MDSYPDSGISQLGHRKLRQHLDTPLLRTGHFRGQEGKIDFVAAEATDFVRAVSEYIAVNTGAMEVVRVDEGFSLDIEFYDLGPAYRHSMAESRQVNHYELILLHPGCENTLPVVFKCDYCNELDSIDGDGTVHIPERPGLGISYNWDYVEVQ